MMKNYKLSLFALILSTFVTSYNFAQDNIQDKKVIITFTWSRIESHGSNQIAVWIEDTKGKHIITLFATHFTASGGYVKRPLALSEWVAKFDLKNASKEDVDAITGATPQSGKQTFIWNCKDKTGKALPSGKYIVRMEANILDADKMFFKGEINVGGNDQKTNGEITFSNPNLASGNVLFKDVLVEYK
jgi:hypothetical protein